MREKKMGRRAALLLLAAALCLPAASYAFLTAERQKINQAVMGENTTTVEERFEEPDPLEPGQTHGIIKEITVKNQQNVPCYVRARILAEDTEVSCSWKDLNTEEWRQLGEYYYYTEELEPGESTTPLAGLLALRGEEAREEFRIFVYEESVQALDPSTGENWGWLEAWQHYVGEEGGVTA